MKSAFLSNDHSSLPVLFSIQDTKWLQVNAFSPVTFKVPQNGHLHLSFFRPSVLILGVVLQLSLRSVDLLFSLLVWLVYSEYHDVLVRDHNMDSSIHPVRYRRVWICLRVFFCSRMHVFDLLLVFNGHLFPKVDNVEVCCRPCICWRNPHILATQKVLWSVRMIPW